MTIGGAGELHGSVRFYCSDSGKQTKSGFSGSQHHYVMFLAIGLQVCWVVRLQNVGLVHVGSMCLSCWNKKLLVAGDRGSSSQDKPGTIKTSAQVTFTNIPLTH